MQNNIKNYKVSVVVPVYNSEKYLPRCINSIIKQTHSNIEIIIINDCSANDTYKTISPYLHDNRIIYYELKENLGGFGARVKGVDLSSGEYICFVDSDDYIGRDYCRALLSKALDTQSDIVCANMIIEDEASGYKYYHPYNEPNGITLQGRELISDFFNIRGHAFFYQSIWNKIYKKSLWDSSRKYLFRVKEHFLMGDDIALSTVLFFHCAKYSSIDYYGYFYIQREQASTSNKIGYKRFKRNIENIAYAFEFVENFLYQVNYYDEVSFKFDKFKELYCALWSRDVSYSRLLSEQKSELKKLLSLLFGINKIRPLDKNDSYFYSISRKYDSEFEKFIEKIASRYKSLIIDLNFLADEENWDLRYLKLIEIAYSLKKRIVFIESSKTSVDNIKETFNLSDFDYEIVKFDDLKSEYHKDSFIIFNEENKLNREFVKKRESHVLFANSKDYTYLIPSLLLKNKISSEISNNLNKIISMIKNKLLLESAYTISMSNFYSNPYLLGYCALGTYLLYNMRNLLDYIKMNNIKTLIIEKHNALLYEAALYFLGNKIEIKAIEPIAPEMWMRQHVKDLFDVKKAGVYLNVEVLNAKAIIENVLEIKNNNSIIKMIEKEGIKYTKNFANLSQYNNFIDVLISNKVPLPSNAKIIKNDEAFLTLFREDIFPCFSEFNNMHCYCIDQCIDYSIVQNETYKQIIKKMHENIEDTLSSPEYYVLSRLQFGAKQFILDIVDLSLFESKVNDIGLTSIFQEMFSIKDALNLVIEIRPNRGTPYNFIKEEVNGHDHTDSKYEFLYGYNKAVKLLFYLLFDREPLKSKVKRVFKKKND